MDEIITNIDSGPSQALEDDYTANAPSLRSSKPRDIPENNEGSWSRIQKFGLSMLRKLTRDESKIYPGPLDPMARKEYMKTKPKASFSGVGRYQCTHLTMVRHWSATELCPVCRKVGKFGWLYRCSTDRDIMVEANPQDIGLHTFDSTRNALKGLVSPRARTQLTRTDELDILDEMSDAQLKQYTPAKLKRLILQRRAVINTSRQGLHELMSSRGFDGKDAHIPDEVSECKFKCCSRCKSSFKDRTFLPLNAIVDGDTPASAATGFGFHLLGERPVVNAALIKNIGQPKENKVDFSKLEEPEPPFLPISRPVAFDTDDEPQNVHLLGDHDALTKGLTQKVHNDRKLRRPEALIGDATKQVPWFNFKSVTFSPRSKTAKSEPKKKKKGKKAKASVGKSEDRKITAFDLFWSDNGAGEATQPADESEVCPVTDNAKSEYFDPDILNAVLQVANSVTMARQAPDAPDDCGEAPEECHAQDQASISAKGQLCEAALEEVILEEPALAANAETQQSDDPTEQASASSSIVTTPSRAHLPRKAMLPVPVQRTPRSGTPKSRVSMAVMPKIGDFQSIRRKAPDSEQMSALMPISEDGPPAKMPESRIPRLSPSPLSRTTSVSVSPVKYSAKARLSRALSVSNAPFASSSLSSGLPRIYSNPILSTDAHTPILSKDISPIRSKERVLKLQEELKKKRLLEQAECGQPRRSQRLSLYMPDTIAEEEEQENDKKDGEPSEERVRRSRHR